MTLAWHIAFCFGATVSFYFQTSHAGIAIVNWHHRRAVRRMRQHEVTFTPLQPGPALPVISTTERLTEQRVKQMEEEIKKLHAELHSRSDGHSNVTVTKRAGVPATTPHVEDDPRWEWRDGNWVARSDKSINDARFRYQQQKMLSDLGMLSLPPEETAPKTRYLRPGEWASND